MGYRSDVALKFDDNMSEAIWHVRKLNGFVDEILNEGMTGCPNSFYWGHIKWYDEYPEIAALNTLLAKLDCEQYGFIRLGEDTNDEEHRGSPCDYDLYTSRSIVM